LDGSFPENAPAAVPGHPAVGVDDYLAAGQAGVAHRAADLEPPGRVNQQTVAGGVKVQPGQHWRHHEVADVGGEQFLEVDIGSVLRRDHHRVEADRLIAGILDGHLGLPVRPQVGNFPVAAHVRQLPGEPVRQHDRQGHQLCGVPARVPEHQPLIAGALPVQFAGALALPVLVRVQDALGDIG
jgi:hypothetical protein